MLNSGMNILKRTLVGSFFLIESFLIRALQFMRKFLQWYQEDKKSNSKSDMHSYGDIGDFAIVITTFEARFFKYALPLVTEIRKHTDLPIYITINGNYEKTRDNINLKNFLFAISQFVNVYPIAFANLRGCATLWNSGIEIADSKNYLVLNDDIHINGSSLIDVMLELESVLRNDGLVTINSSFSHFAISEKCLEEVGLFDEHFLGFGEEDGDYIHRYQVEYGKSHVDYKSDNFFNLSDASRDTNIVNSVSKYSMFNLRMRETFYQHDEKSIVKGAFDKPMTRVVKFVSPRPVSSFRKKHYRELSE